MNKSFCRPIHTLFGLLFALVLAAGLSTQSHAMTGAGTEADPYVITSAGDLAAMHNDLAAHYALGTSIYMSGVKHTPIGNEEEGAFTGSLDGNGYTIYDLTVSDAGAKYSGLFGYVEGSVTDLTLSNVSVVGSRYLGGVAGYVSEGAALSDCHVRSGSITCTTALMDVYMGGIAGRCDGTLSGSFTNGANLTVDVKQSIYAGGITGCLTTEAHLTDCTNSGRISVVSKADNDEYVGGLIGYASSSISLTVGFNSGAITDHHTEYYGSPYVGGLIGRSAGDVILSRCSNIGSISVLDEYYYLYSGGIIGYANSATLTDCSNSGTISSECEHYARSGGMVGTLDKFSATNCSNSGNVLVKVSWPSSTIYWAEAGGLSGYSPSSSLTNCANTGDVSVVSDDRGYLYAGGMIGRGSGTLLHCLNQGSISISNEGYYSYSGGMIGYGSGVLRYCSNEGTVSTFTKYSDSCSGGMIGFNYSSATLTNCSNSGLIVASSTYNYVYLSASVGYKSGSPEISDFYNCGNIRFSDSRSYKLPSHHLLRDLYFHNTGAGIVAYDEEGEPGMHLSSNGIKLHRLGSEGWYCSDIRYHSDFTGSPKTFVQLRDPTLYTGWDVETGLSYGWVVDHNKNSGLPFPEDMRTDLFNESVLFLTPGQASQLTAEFEVERWESSDPEVVKCVNGTVTALRPGAVGVAAYSADGKHRANCIIYVYQPVDSITVTPGSSTLAYGGTTTMTTDLYKDYPDDPQAIHWTSSDPAVATVDAAGKVTAKGGGVVTITGYAPLSGVSASCTITVTANITGLSVPSTQIIYAGEPTPLSCTVTPTVYTGTLSWTSSDESVVTVEDGVLTGLKPGMSIITVTSDTGLSDTCTVTVLQRSASLSLDRTALTLEMGLTDQLIATVLPENTTDTLSWSSSSTSVVTVSSTGVLTPKRTGQAIITCSTTSGLKAYCTVTVVNKEILPTSVTLDQNFLRPNVGVKTQLKATLAPSNATDPTIIWSSSDPSVATVNSTGVVEAVAPGTAIITAASHNGFYDTCEVKVAVTSSAAFILTGERAHPGDLVATQVHIAKNPGIAAMTLGLDYDTSLLTPVSVTPGECLLSGTFTSNLEELGSNNLRVTWYSDKDMSENGLAFTVTWQVSEQALDDIPVSVSFNADDICNQEPANVTFAIEPCVVELVDYLVGDIYPDEQVNMKDIVYLARWFNELESLDATQRLAADLHYDGAVDVKDLTVLSQYLTAALPEPSAQMLRMTRSAPYTIALSDARVDENGSAVISVTGQNCPGIAAFRFALRVPQGYEVTAVTPSSVLSDGVFEFNSDTGIVTWHHTQPVVLDGPLFTICVQADDSAPERAEISLDYSAADFFTLPSYTDIPVAVSSGVVESKYYNIISAQLDGSSLTVTAQTNKTGSGRMIVAAYSGSQFLASSVAEISLSQTTNILPYTPPSGYDTIKIFVLSADTAYSPICRPFTLDS